MNPGHRYSTFALDVYWSSGRPPDVDLEKHLESCKHCRSYLGELSAQDAAGAPAWPSTSLPPKTRQWRTRLSPLASALIAVVAAFFLAIHNRAPNDAPSNYVGIKGAPAVQVLLQRNRQIAIWDGSEALNSGDALALRVDCAEFAHIAIASLDAARGTWVQLTDAECPAEDAPLPFTLQIDDQPGDEHLAIVFSAAKIDNHDLTEAILRSSRTSSTWAQQFTFAKNPKMP